MRRHSGDDAGRLSRRSAHGSGVAECAIQANLLDTQPQAAGHADGQIVALLIQEAVGRVATGNLVRTRFPVATRPTASCMSRATICPSACPAACGWVSSRLA